MKLSKFINLIECGSSAVIQLNRPKAMNAINMEMMDHVHQLLKLLEPRKDVVVFKGLPNLFSSGGDIIEISQKPPQKSWLHATSRILTTIDNYKKPYVALVDGMAFGGAMCCFTTAKFSVVTERTVFSLPENVIGFFNDCGSGYFMPRLDRNLGIYIALTASKINGVDMAKSKLVTNYVESGKLPELETKLLTCKTHDDVARVMKLFSTDPQAQETEIDSLLPQIEKCFGAPTVEGIFENLDKDGSDWAKKTLSKMNRMSPTSLKVSHRLLKLGRHLSLRELLRIEHDVLKFYGLTQNSHGNREGKEGIRAFLLEKDNKPNWKPKALAEVTDEYIDEFFMYRPEEGEIILELELKDH